MENRSSRDIGAALLLACAGIALGGLLAYIASPALRTHISAITPGYGVAPAIVTSPFIYSFNTDGIVEETGSPDDTRSPYFWLNSGGRLVIEGGIGKTLQGDTPSTDRWYEEYAGSDPADTDGGKHPQNLFRLLTRSTWDNVRQEIDVYITADNFSDSENRNSSNGILLFSRYEDGDTLYYAGVRVDGTAVIKKKYGGVYYTMAQEKVFSGAYQGDQDRVNLLPHDTWMSVRMETSTNVDLTVTIRLSIKPSPTEPWKEVLTAVDRGQHDDTPPIINKAPVGIRTDFMDVHFKNLRIERIAE